MILSMATFTLVHVVLSLAGIATGFIVIGGFLSAKQLNKSTALFLATTVATSATGFGFKVDHFMPSHALGIISLVLLVVAIYALYVKHLAGGWRWIYVVAAIMAQYLNFFVLLIQLFRRVPALMELASTQSEPPFAITQGIALVLFVVLGILSVRRFCGSSGSAT
jgi:hypothetical protein